MKARFVVAVAVLLVVGALGASYYLFFIRRESHVEAPPPPPPEVLRVSAASGTVEVAGADGVFHSVAPGASLSAHDRIRTADDGIAELRGADGSTVKLLGATVAGVSALSRELKRLQLGKGMIEAEIKDDPARLFEIELGDGAAARTRGASFVASADGDGNAEVASRRGEVVLAAHGREVVIRAGQQARVRGAHPPEQPTPIPASLFLKVNWPAAATSQRRQVVTGTTAPGARVQVNGRYVRVKADGTYTAELDLPDGQHQLSVRAADVGGHRRDEKSPSITVDTQTNFKVNQPTWK